MRHSADLLQEVFLGFFAYNVLIAFGACFFLGASVKSGVICQPKPCFLSVFLFVANNPIRVEQQSLRMKSGG